MGGLAPSPPRRQGDQRKRVKTVKKCKKSVSKYTPVYLFFKIEFSNSSLSLSLKYFRVREIE
jgi:hypothetical protein